MKYLYLLIALSLSSIVIAQVGNQNYICTRTMLNTSGKSYIEQIVYYDGLGLPFQTVHKPVENDKVPANSILVTLQEYDDVGRADKTWLPIVASSDYLAPSSFKSAAPGNHDNDSRPYSQPIYEPSPLNRIVQQYDPGAAWYSGHPVAVEYLTNTSTPPLHCINYSVNTSGTLVDNGNYAATQLKVTKTTDEDGNVSYSFADKLDRVILIRRMEGNLTNDTYYVFDDYGNQCFVLQPMYQENANLALYAFQYKYDGRNRCIEKKLPSVQAITYVYDMADNLIFSQDGNQRTTKQWTFYLYDKFRRLVVQGVCENTNTDSASSEVVSCIRLSTNSGLGNSGYSSSFTLTSATLHMVNYYDGYDFLALTGFVGDNHFPAVNASVSATSKGFLTGSVITLIENGAKLYSANYYDNEGRVVKSVSSNHMGGYETVSTTYTFTGKPLTVQHVHSAAGKDTQTEIYTYGYDHAERVIKVQYSLNNKTVTMADNTYDNFGRLHTKSLHGSGHMLTYTYNIRDWLIKIDGLKFTQNLYYNTGTSTAYYNGNISSMTWVSGDEDVTRGYKFTYDNLNRMKNAANGESSTISANAGRFSENVTGYDKNGNIRYLQRYGKTSSTIYGMIDNLTIVYDGNQLKYANDAATDPLYSGAFNFVDGSNSTGIEYKYDANGNLEQDYDKKISKVQYNSLNLPSTLQFTNGNCADYFYGADGVKRRVVHKTAIANVSVPMGQIVDLADNQVSHTDKTDYCGNVIYENESLSKILTEEGYVTVSGGVHTYHYYLKDHQENNRVVINQTGTVEQINHYYPFGGLFEVNTATSGIQSYKYNGKELDRMHGLDWYDYGARMYDATLGRWHVVDPMGEKYYSTSPYTYCLNSPVNAVDKQGKLVLFINGFHNGSGGTSKYWGGFDIMAMKILNDDKFLYKDGALGGFKALKEDNKILNANYRKDYGYKEGKMDAMKIVNMISDERGNIKETIKILTHSMGAAYAKGYIQALKEYFVENNIPLNSIAFEMDFAPFQPTKQTAVEGVATYQVTNTNDMIANNRLLGSPSGSIKGATVYFNNDEHKGHSITDFIDQLWRLPTGTYRVDEKGNIIREK